LTHEFTLFRHYPLGPLESISHPYSFKSLEP
jgi:hypothetical protein